MKQHLTPSPKLGQWIGYSGMATAFLAIAPKAEAQVVYTDVDPDVVLVNGEMDFDFDGDGIVDLNISQSHSIDSSATFNSDFVNIPSGNAVVGSSSYGSIYPYVLASGAPIAPGDPNLQSGSFGTLFLGGTALNWGNWEGQSGYLGCRFLAGDGEVHYGWIQLAVGDNGSSITVFAYGYESTPDMAINAGDMGLTTGVADAQARTFDVNIMPNPVSDRAVINFPNTGTEHMRMSLLNGLGQTLFTDEMGNMDSYTLNVADYAPGVYFVRLQDGKKVAFRKLTKQ